MFGTAYEGTVDWLILQDPANPDVTIHAHATFLLSNWECQFGKCPGLLGEEDKTFVADVGCCVDGFYVADAEDHDRIQEMVQRLTDEDWDPELRAYVLKRGYKKGATNDAEALARGWQHWIKKPKSGIDNVTDDEEWILKSRVQEKACVFANRSTGSTGKLGCAFLHLGMREQARKRKLAESEVVEPTSSVRDARHDIYMPVVCHQLPLRFVHEFDNEDEDGEPLLSSIAIQPWDADQWPGVEGSEYGGNWWCVDDPASYTAKTPLYVRMRGTIEQVIGNEAYEALARELDKRRDTVSAMHVLGSGIAEGRALIPLAVEGKKLMRPAPMFTEHWNGQLALKAD